MQNRHKVEVQLFRLIKLVFNQKTGLKHFILFQLFVHLLAEGRRSEVGHDSRSWQALGVVGFVLFQLSLDFKFPTHVANEGL